MKMKTEVPTTPTTIEEVESTFDRYFEEFTSTSLKGIFRCKIGLGSSVSEAYDKTLNIFAEILTKKLEKNK